MAFSYSNNNLSKCVKVNPAGLKSVEFSNSYPLGRYFDISVEQLGGESSAILKVDKDTLKVVTYENNTWTDRYTLATKSDLSQNIIAKTFNAQVTVKANEGYICDVPFTVPAGYELLDVVDTYIQGTPAALCQQGIVEDKIRVYIQPFYDGTGGVYVKVLFKKKS